MARFLSARNEKAIETEGISRENPCGPSICYQALKQQYRNVLFRPRIILIRKHGNNLLYSRA